MMMMLMMKMVLMMMVMMMTMMMMTMIMTTTFVHYAWAKARVPAKDREQQAVDSYEVLHEPWR